MPTLSDMTKVKMRQFGGMIDGGARADFDEKERQGQEGGSYCEKLPLKGA